MQVREKRDTFKGINVQDQMWRAGMDLSFHGLGNEFELATIRRNGGKIPMQIPNHQLSIPRLLEISEELYQKFKPDIASDGKAWNGKFTHLVG